MIFPKSNRIYLIMRERRAGAPGLEILLDPNRQFNYLKVFIHMIQQRK